MVLRVKLIGSGVEGDPYRVNLPTYQLLHGNITHGYAVVAIPDHVHGLTEQELASEEYEETSEGRFYPRFSDGTLARLHSNLDEKYQEHKGKFRVEHV